MKSDAFNFDVNEELRKIRENISGISRISNDINKDFKIDSLENTNVISNISSISSTPAVHLNFSKEDKNKIVEVNKLIRSYALYWGETENNIDEYIKDQLASYPLDDLLNCFKALNTDIKI